MSKLDYLKSEIDNLDHELFGSNWTIAGFKNISVIKEEFTDEFEGVWTSAIELSILKKDLPSGAGEDDICMRQEDGAVYVVRRVLPEIDDVYMFLVTKHVDSHI
jgi:hypothetical protein